MPEPGKHGLQEEKELLLRTAEGEEEAFARLYQYYYSQLHTYLWRFTGSSADTTEILQATFIRVWLSRDKLPTIEHFRAWVYKVCSREAMSFLRKRLEEKNQLTKLSAGSPTNIPAATPFELLNVSQIQTLITEAIAQMPASRKRIFQMHRLEGLKVGEIATRMGLSVSTVKNTVAAAQKHIRQHLSAAGYELPAALFFLFF
ncbi:MAG: sigma-70 family RNA polymerase sigma factor [Candidatus Pseudobacter hemicellulosilyticus]|uniref:Sigma-70 family RNA polymerase sigma factor n=1 Tax=Candidatus Pseudobacter hemicellulosilyticus TaxID=3121375 RepID=A0AAJ5WMC3_9BACT|nr:MAG: sigma-70 family RNA polymerase sigma factor [Pseudobacter sp.]